jgi:hypothetical protein
VNQQLEYRGEGYEVRTSGWGAIRAGKGVMMTTCDRPAANGRQTGLIQVDHHPTTQQYTLKLANGTSYALPVAEHYRRNAGNGALANRGFHFHEAQRGTDADAIDRAQHRADYDNWLDPDQDDRP